MDRYIKVRQDFKPLGPMSNFVAIDGSMGEGGGQVLRTALTLSMLTGKPFRITNIRAQRRKPGLAPQHLACVRAAGKIAQAEYKGAAIGSMSLYFQPGEVQSGDYDFRIGTAGATSLVLQTVHLPLALRGQLPSNLTISGGTHVPHAPCFHFLETTWSAYMRRLGCGLHVELIQPGFYPQGGGKITARIETASKLQALQAVDRPELNTVGGFSAVANLPMEIAQRQARRLMQRLASANLKPHIDCQRWSSGVGTVLTAVFRQNLVPTLFTALGERGKPAERVADDLADEALAFVDSRAAVDHYSADQLVLPLSLAAEVSHFTVSRVTPHLLTNIRVIEQFLNRTFTCEGQVGHPGMVRIAAA